MPNSNLLTISDVFADHLVSSSKMTHIQYLHLHCTLGQTTQCRHTDQKISIEVLISDVPIQIIDQTRLCEADKHSFSSMPSPA